MGKVQSVASRPEHPWWIAARRLAPREGDLPVVERGTPEWDLWAAYFARLGWTPEVFLKRDKFSPSVALPSDLPADFDASLAPFPGPDVVLRKPLGRVRTKRAAMYDTALESGTVRPGRGRDAVDPGRPGSVAGIASGWARPDFIPARSHAEALRVQAALKVRRFAELRAEVRACHDRGEEFGVAGMVPDRVGSWRRVGGVVQEALDRVGMPDAGLATLKERDRLRAERRAQLEEWGKGRPAECDVFYDRSAVGYEEIHKRALREPEGCWSTPHGIFVPVGWVDGAYDDLRAPA